MKDQLAQQFWGQSQVNQEQIHTKTEIVKGASLFVGQN